MLFPFQYVFGQDKLWEEKQTILSDYYRMKANDTTFRYEVVNRNNIISVEINGTDSLKLIHYFNLDSTSGPESLCDSLEIYLECAKCMDETLMKIISDRDRKWQQMIDGSYISGKYLMWSQTKAGAEKTYTIPVMQIYREADHAEVIIYTTELSKTKWKQKLRTEDDSNITIR